MRVRPNYRERSRAFCASVLFSARCRAYISSATFPYSPHLQSFPIIMQSLLRWGIENSTKEDLEEAIKAPRQPLDPAIIDHILGKPDAVVMKVSPYGPDSAHTRWLMSQQESLEIAVDESRPEDERVAALDNLEMVCRSLQA